MTPAARLLRRGGTSQTQELAQTGASDQIADATPIAFQDDGAYNDIQVVRDGAHTGAKPGRVVRGPGWTGAPR